ncbi:MAG: hypothetical protein HRT88_22335 [Lentisphaeraceae bacterium]|nr:hypothetical protein [Lentisphaeraceae bacterium]
MPSPQSRNKYKTTIFVHSFFWHRHQGRKESSTPKTRHVWWMEKFAQTVERDKRNQKELEDMNWKVV